MTFEEVAERLRKHGRTCRLFVYESGYQAQIYDSDSKYIGWHPLCETLDEAAEYLHAAAKRLYPDTYGKDEE